MTSSMGNLKSITLPLLLAFSLLLPFAESDWFMNYHIHITNDLPLRNSPPNQPNLFLHCKSKKRDIGDRPMMKGQDYTWDTKVNFFRTTLFFCNARWVGHKRISFDAFEAKRDEKKCLEYHNSCMWSVRADGIYFSKDDATWFNAYRW
ncbi:self-incompatibility protein S1-like [Hibiscus syriacus]|uniref:self-incompatibility protein S1-like n=1 Tax=Hibiscus syriacus TaxID=106335 RepID=UPI0019239C95|nr:self-incompatibility protein S1-like [Hibiscus syriacus]